MFTTDDLVYSFREEKSLAYNIMSKQGQQQASSQAVVDKSTNNTLPFTVVRPASEGDKPPTSFLLTVKMEEQEEKEKSFTVVSELQQPNMSIEYLLLQCGEHPNRFVREYAFLCLADLVPLVPSIRPAMYQCLAFGLQDNWSQVKYASSKAVRHCVQHPTFDRENLTHLRVIAPYMCLN